VTDADRKRAYVSDLYSGKSWKRKVSRMPDEQITAIYLKHQGDGEKPDEHEDPVQETRLDINDIPSATPVSVDGPGPHHNEDDFFLY